MENCVIGGRNLKEQFTELDDFVSEFNLELGDQKNFFDENGKVCVLKVVINKKNEYMEVEYQSKVSENKFAVSCEYSKVEENKTYSVRVQRYDGNLKGLDLLTENQLIEFARKILNKAKETIKNSAEYKKQQDAKIVEEFLNLI